jgi:hypothetical protein
MNDFISHVLAAIERDGSEIAAVFPGLAGLTVVYKFSERLANDVVSIVILVIQSCADHNTGCQIAEYINPLLSQCRLLSQELFLTATAATFVEAWRVVEKMAALASSLASEDGLVSEAAIPLEYSRLLGQVVCVHGRLLRAGGSSSHALLLDTTCSKSIWMNTSRKKLNTPRTA